MVAMCAETHLRPTRLGGTRHSLTSGAAHSFGTKLKGPVLVATPLTCLLPKIASRRCSVEGEWKVHPRSVSSCEDSDTAPDMYAVVRMAEQDSLATCKWGLVSLSDSASSALWRKFERSLTSFALARASTFVSDVHRLAADRPGRRSFLIGVRNRFPTELRGLGLARTSFLPLTSFAFATVNGWAMFAISRSGNL